LRAIVQIKCLAASGRPSPARVDI